MKQLFALMLCVFSFSGCSVFLAASSPDQPDLSILQSGTARTQVEEQLGPPITFTRQRGGDMAVYQFPGPDEVSYERAAAYAVADILTVGFAELITTGVEAMQADQHTITVIYDRNSCVKNAYHTVQGAPLEKPEIMLGIEKRPESGMAQMDPEEL